MNRGDVITRTVGVGTESVTLPPTKEWEFAILGQDEARKAHVHWLPGQRLPEELIAIAVNLGYTSAELATYSLGELKDDLEIDGALYLRGALVLPDEQGYPAALFGKPLVKSPH